MKRLLFLAVVCWAYISQAQQPSEEWQPDLLLKSSWPTPPSISNPYRFEATILLTRQQTKIGKTHYETGVVRAVWVKDRSWLADSLLEKYAAYSQLLFDCYEYEARRISGYINAEGSDSLLTLMGAWKRADELRSSMDLYTEKGENEEKMLEMRTWMDSLLRVTPKYDLPGSETVNNGFFMDVGPGTRFYSGALSDYLAVNAGFSFGFKLRVRRIGIEFNRMIGATKALRDLELEDFKFEKEERLSIRQNALSIGYETIKNRRFSCMPFVGLGTFRVMNLEQPDGSLYNRGPMAVNPAAGVSISYFTLPFYQDDHLQYGWYFVFRSQLDHIYYVKEVKGNTLRFQVGVGIAFNRIRTLMQD